jgi:primosomal protein N' (replication factor Y)
MYIATVIPLSKSIQKENLTYFTAKEIPLGSIVSVPVRSKMIDAIVIELEDASNLKGGVKDADFQLKKIDSVLGMAPFRQSFFEACVRMQKYYATTTGAIIDAMLPNIFLERYSEFEKPKIITKNEEEKNIVSEKVIFQALPSDRLSWYRTLVREAFAKKQSVFVCVPTEYDIDIFYNAFSKGIEQYVFRFHGNINKKTLIADYNRAITEEHAVIIIGTGMFLSIPRYDIKTIVVEHESSEAYKGIRRPYVDVRGFAEVLAECDGSRLIYGDTLLRPETLHRHDIKELGEVASPLFRLPSVERQIILDMKEEVNEKGMQTFTVLGDTTMKMIEYAQAHNESVFLFTVRKGLAGITVCGDCGDTMLCNYCKVPIVLYNKRNTKDKNTTEERIFMCNKCGRRETAKARCQKCDSWNLTPLGIGTDRVKEEIERLFPKATVVQIDKEATPTEKEVKIAQNKIENTKNVILIGTEMAFSSINQEFTHSAIVSLDGLLSIPSFNINQKILHIIEKLSLITTRNMIIQTRIPETPILQHILTGNVLPIYREDLKERETFGYPPYKKLIKITFTGNARDSEKARNYLEEIFTDYDPQIFSAFAGRVKGEYVINTVLKVDPKTWPFPPKLNTFGDNKESIALADKLQTLSPAFSINIDPEDLL